MAAIALAPSWNCCSTSARVSRTHRSCHRLARRKTRRRKARAKMTPLIRHYVEARLFEWVMAIGMIGLGIEIIIFPDVVRGPSFMLLAAIFPKLSIDIFLIFFGSLRIAALIANGS